MTMFRYPDKTYSMRKIFLPILAMMVLAFTGCTKEESLEEMPIVEDQNNSWSFVEGGTEYRGVVDTAFIELINGTEVLTIEGTATSGTQGNIALLLVGDPVGVGNYPSPLSALLYIENGAFKYETDPATPGFTIGITQFSTTSVSGTFSGLVKENGVDRNVTEGSFKATF